MIAKKSNLGGEIPLNYLKKPLTFSRIYYIIIIERGKHKTGKQGGN